MLSNFLHALAQSLCDLITHSIHPDGTVSFVFIIDDPLRVDLVDENIRRPMPVHQKPSS